VGTYHLIITGVYVELSNTVYVPVLKIFPRYMPGKWMFLLQDGLLRLTLARGRQRSLKETLGDDCRFSEFHLWHCI